MRGFKVLTPGGQTLHFLYYLLEAPVTSAAFHGLLPFRRTFTHARVSGQEIWIDDVPPLDIIQENATLFTEPGEVVFGPAYPLRNKTANCMGIYYGEGKGLDACNVFARVMDRDRELLSALGEAIWKNGQQELVFEGWD